MFKEYYFMWQLGLEMARMVGEKFSEVFRIKTLNFILISDWIGYFTHWVTLKRPLEFAHNFRIEMSENSGCFKSWSCHCECTSPELTLSCEAQLDTSTNQHKQSRVRAVCWAWSIIVMVFWTLSTLYCQTHSLFCLHTHMKFSDIPFLVHRV